MELYSPSFFYQALCNIWIKTCIMQGTDKSELFAC